MHPPFAQHPLRRSLAHSQIPADQSRGELNCMFCQCMSAYPDHTLSPSLLTGASLKSCSSLHNRRDRRTGRNEEKTAYDNLIHTWLFVSPCADCAYLGCLLKALGCLANLFSQARNFAGAYKSQHPQVADTVSAQQLNGPWHCTNAHQISTLRLLL